MKQHITVDDLLQLDASQRDALNNLWLPELYDLAVAYVCRDAENDVYDLVEVVVGEIIVQQSYGKKFYNITIRNLKGMSDVKPDENESFEDEEVDFEADEESFELIDTVPEYFNKNDCMPILNIGQMIRILRDNGYGEGSFYLDIKNKEDISGVGREITQYVSYGRDFESNELCDALWEAVKTLL
ncbi:MAG: hypothetical protein ACOZCL_19510 [Bacillota bacterium]